MNAINSIIAALIVTAVCGAICVRLSPRCLRELAAWCRATADADDARIATHARLMRMYRQEMGLPVKDNLLRLRKRDGVIEGSEVLR